MEVTLRGKTYKIETHREGYGGPQYAAANIKLHTWPEPDSAHTEKLEQMQESDWLSEDRWRSEQNYAWEDAAAEWWEWSKQKAKDWGLGRVYSTGRQGGYIVLDAFPESRVVDLEDGARGDKCVHCRTYYVAHARGKCLYGPTMYEAHMPPDRGSQASLLEVIRFLKQCERSVKLWAAANYTYQLEWRIDQLWEEYQTE